MAKQPTKEQLSALNEFRAQYGAKWKDVLSLYWMDKRQPMRFKDEWTAPLTQLRNQFGPSWLATYRIPTAKAYRKAPAKPAKAKPAKRTKAKPATPEAPTRVYSGEFQSAFDFFNAELFKGRLPQCVIHMARGKKFLGYFWPERFSADGFKQTTHEIALNPDAFGRDVRETLGTLVHEMCHLEQCAFGKMPRNGYHDSQWAGMMRAVGLTPRNVKNPEKQTGPSCTHSIDEGGAFDKACAKLMASGFKITYISRPVDADAAKKKRASKTKYTCQCCGQNAWGKPESNLLCGDCDGEPMIAIAAD